MCGGSSWRWLKKNLHDNHRDLDLFFNALLYLACLFCFVWFGQLRLRGGCGRPPVFFIGMPRWPVTVRGPYSCTSDGDPFLCLVPASYLLCTDLATDLVRGSARPLLVLECQAPLLLGCVPRRPVTLEGRLMHT